MNSFNGIGRITKDLELRYLQSGTAMVRFTLAINRSRKAEGQPEADFLSCVAFNKTAENLANFMKKGSLIGVEGRIQTGSYEGQDGKRVFTTDVIADSIQFLEPRGDSTGQAPQQQPQQQGQPPRQQQPQQQQYQQPPQNQQNYTRVDEDPFANSKGPIEVSEDDLPF